MSFSNSAKARPLTYINAHNQAVSISSRPKSIDPADYLLIQHENRKYLLI